MSELPELPIVLDPARDWCDRHREPFRERWPAGILPATLALLELACRNPKVVAAATPEGSELADVELLGRVLVELGPLCCLAGDLEARRSTRLALAGDIEAFAVALDELRSREA